MIKVDCKEGVWFKFISYEFLVAAQVVWKHYSNQSVVPTVTSACDSQHCEGSYHYTGLAWDFRIWGLNNPENVANAIRSDLRNIDYRYDVIFEGDHIHIEYDLNKGAT